MKFMKKIFFLASLFALGAVFLTACDTDDKRSYKFKGTIEVIQDPDDGSGTVDLTALAGDAYYDGIISFRAVVKDTSGKELNDISVYWGTENVSSDPKILQFPDHRRMTINTKFARYQAGEKISVKAAYGGIESSAKKITFTKS